MSIEIKIRIEFKRNIKISKKIKIYNLFFQFFDLSNVDKKRQYRKRNNNTIEIKNQLKN